MSALAFGFEDQLVRVHDRGGAPWFVAQDVCSCLEIANSRDAVASLDEDEKGYVGITDAMGRDRQTAIVSESGVYVLIFRSRKDSAKRFRKWVTAEVLPTLRRTGSYAMPDAANDQCEPLDGGRMDEERHTMLSLAVVREARQVWGRDQARKIWRQLGLPDGCEKKREALESRAFNHYRENPPTSIVGWLDECTKRAEGRTQSGVLYDSYLAWCADQGFEAENTVKFGMTLSALGFEGKRFDGGRVSRMGIALK